MNKNVPPCSFLNDTVAVSTVKMHRFYGSLIPFIAAQLTQDPCISGVIFWLSLKSPAGYVSTELQISVSCSTEVAVTSSPLGAQSAGMLAPANDASLAREVPTEALICTQ